jgi:sugar/nucleoside kinase (ribokinase family)
VDWIVRAVDRRTGPEPDAFVPIRTIEGFAARCAAAAGKSTNVEIVDQETRWGGNGPLLAGALAVLGMRSTFVGAVGQTGDWSRLDPTYQPLDEVCETVVPITAPGRTEALEFDDGKIMLNRTSSIQALTWELIVDRVGLDRLRELMRGAKLIGLVNWSLMGRGEEVWRGLMADVLSHTRDADRPHVFVDISDPAKRTDESLRSALETLREVNGVAPVTLGLNLAEGERVASVLGLDFERGRDGVAELRSALDLECLVIHPRDGAGGATEGEAAWFDGPLARSPRVSTGAGDHFNAGFAMSRCAGLELAESLAVGCATSGLFVRQGRAPTRGAVAAFLRTLPAPEVD